MSKECIALFIKEKDNECREEGKEVKLRCKIKKKNDKYIGTCLELSIAVKCNTVYECKEKLEQAINDYVDTIIYLVREKNENIIIRPVEYYVIKKLLFDIKMYFKFDLFNKDKLKIEFTKKVVVPSGI
jgi:hypothetical protein